LPEEYNLNVFRTRMKCTRERTEN